MKMQQSIVLESRGADVFYRLRVMSSTVPTSILPAQQVMRLMHIPLKKW